MEKTKLVIIGSGPAGYTAALYAARANLNPVVFEGFFSGPAGGQLMTTTEVENFPGFPEGVTGPELMELFSKQAKKFGAVMLREDVESVDLSKHPFTVNGKNHTYESDSIIIATGATAKVLNIPGAGEGEFWQKGVTACAVCDGAMPIFRNRPLFVIGGGDSACEEALFLTKYASHVYVVHRRDELRASQIMGNRLIHHPSTTVIWDHVMTKIEGGDVVEKVTLKNVKTGEETVHEAGGVFFAIGHNPNTAFLNGQIELHDNDYIKVDPGTATTSVEGVFAAGDCQDFVYRQAITAAGSGCMAALEAERWLASKEIHHHPENVPHP